MPLWVHLYLFYLGINGTIFCYGQTSTGKTFTIVGDHEVELSKK